MTEIVEEIVEEFEEEFEEEYEEEEIVEEVSRHPVNGWCILITTCTTLLHSSMLSPS